MGTPWAKMTEEQKERKNARDRAWRLKNPEKVNARQRAWRLKTPERAKMYQRAWRLKNPEKAKAIKNHQRQKLRLSKLTLAAMAISNELQQQSKGGSNVR